MTLRVLLIQSEAEELLFLQEVLREIEQERLLPEWARIEVSFAATWIEARRILSTSAPHAILLDMALEQEAPCRLVRTAAPNVPVILLADPGMDSLATQWMRDGAEDFLLKPQVDCAPLAHALRNAVLRHRLLSAARAGCLTDSLTGLPNRAGFLAIAERDLKLAERLDRRWMLLLLQPRNLLRISPPLANQRRDLALVEAADQLRGLATPADLIARIGESQFAMTVFEGGLETAEESWARVSSAAVRHRIDVGASIFDPGHPVSLDAMMEQALAGLAHPQPAQAVREAGAG